MKKFFVSFMLFWLATLAGCGGIPEGTPTFFMDLSAVKFQFGDDPRWAAPDFDASDWDESFFNEINSQGEIVWVRTTFYGAPILKNQGSRPIGLYINGLASAEIYLNGVLVGHDGTPAALPGDEVPGTVDTVINLPANLINHGQNQLSIRLSSHHVAFPIYTNLYDLYLAPYHTPTMSRLNLYLPSMPLMGVFILGALFFGLRGMVARKDPASLFLGLASLMIAGQMGAEISRALVQYSYDWHLVRILAILGFAFAFGVAMTAFAGFRFLGKLPVIWLAVGVIVGGFIGYFTPGFDGKTALTLAWFLALSLAITGRGWKTGRREAKIFSLVLGAVVALVLPTFGLFIDRYYYFAMAFFMLTVFALEVLTSRRNEREIHLAVVQSARMELELLKRNIQPHFLMNTLTALAEWMEKNPREGARMIDALAEEFRLLHEMTEKITVPLKDELALCDAHLKLMQFRKNQTYTLEKNISNAESHLPPVILHTLIENAFTHGKIGNNDAIFTLKQTTGDGGAIYTFAAPVTKPAKPTGSKGLGSAYIDARLKEAYGNNFAIEQGPIGNKSWVTTIQINDVKAV